jgi:general secretion pathway protein G
MFNIRFFRLSTGFQNQKGMTLLEIIIVVTILASLGAILANRVADSQKKANVKQAKIIMGDIATKLDMYYTDCGKYPTASEGLAALGPGGESTCTNWGPEPYLKKPPLDPWQTPFVYLFENGNFTIVSYGQDKKEGGAGYDKDIVFPE